MSADPIATLPSALREFAQRNGIGPESVRSGKRLTVTVDKRYRLHMEESTHHRVALFAQLMPLPPAGDRRGDEALQKLVRTGTGMLRDHASTLCIDPAREALMLQQFFASDANPEAVEKAVAEFTNALALWTKLCAAEAVQ